MSEITWRMAELLARALEPVEREAVLGDLLESGDGGAKAVLAIAGLLARRQAEVWRDWRPWLALFGLAVPVGLLLFDFSRTLAGTYHLYAWIVANYGVIELQLLEETGLTLRHGSVVFLSFLFLLLVWSWTGGFALAALSGRAMWINAPLLGLVWCFYAVASPDLPPWPALALLWLSFLWGAREGLCRGSLTRPRAAALFLGTVLLTAIAIVTAGWWRAGNGPSRQVAVALILSWPVCYLMAAAYWRSRRKSALT